MMNLRHHSLVAWQRADDLFIKLHRLTFQAFPAHERFELGSQMRRAAYSVPANIVEGFARRHRRSRLHFLNIAESSLAEVSYCVHVAQRLGYITEAAQQELEADLSRVGAPLAGLIRSTRLMPIVIPIICVCVGSVLMFDCQRFFQ
jgi:four helix bundle protein